MAVTPIPRRSVMRSVLHDAGEFAVFSGRAAAALPRVPRFTSETLRQAAILVRGSLPVIFVMLIFIGFVQTTFAYLLLRSIGGADYLGFVTGISTPRATVPIMFGYIFAAKVGCGLVAEIGSARISEELDALESEAVDVMTYVVGTRILGAALFVPIAAGAALVGAIAGSYIDTVFVLQALPGPTLMDAHWAVQSIRDQVLCLVNLATMAMAIVTVSCFFGYRASGGPAGVGAAVAASMIVNLVVVHVLSAFFVTLFYSQDLHLPVGG